MKEHAFSMERLLAWLPLVWVFGIFVVLWGSFMDDAYIGFRYVENAWEGHGWVFNPGERVEGVTNIGWLLVLFPLALFGSIPIAAKMASLVLVVATLLLIRRLCKDLLQTDAYLGHWVFLLCAVAFEFLFFSFTGMETSLLAFLLGLAALASLRRRHEAAALLLAFAFFVRPEMLLAGLLWVLLLPVLGTLSWRDGLRVMGVYAFTIMLLLAVRYAYYGAWLPNTFRAKPTTFVDFLYRLVSAPRHQNIIVNIPPLFELWVTVCIGALGAIVKWRPSDRDAALLIGLTVLGGWLFCIYAGADWTGMGRYFAPYMPFALLLLLRGVSIIIAGVVADGRIRRLLLGAVASSILLGGVFDASYLLRPKVQAKYPWFVAHSKTLVPAARWVEANTPEDAVIATRRIGCLAFYGRRKIFDYKYGLVSREVADLVVSHHGHFEAATHPHLAEVWRRVDPDYVMEDEGMVQSWKADPRQPEVTIHGLRYRRIKSFDIHPEDDWVLWEKVGKTN